MEENMNEKREAEEKVSEELKAMERAKETVQSGRLKLAAPIRSNGQEVKELRYDFTKVTGREYVRAMDRGDDGARKNSFRITDEQALCLFAVAAEKASEDVDARDVEEQLGVEDCIKAIQAATTFFIAASRAGNYRISKQ